MTDENTNDDKPDQHITRPEPLSIRLDGLRGDADLLEGYVGVNGQLHAGVTLIASGRVDGEEVVKLTGGQAEWLETWLREARREASGYARELRGDDE